MSTPAFQAGHVVGQLLVYVGIPAAVLALLWAIRALWRASRRVTVETVGHTAGALTRAASERRDRLTKAFRASRDAS